ncbi:MAG: hypothetical protein ABI321_16305 [Polyangia bacterium]
MSALRIAALLLVLPLVASAAPRKDRVDPKVEQEGERLEIAREHFMRAEALADKERLEEALVEYELSEFAHPSPSVTEAKARVRARLDARPRAQVVTVLTAQPVAIEDRPLHRFIAPIVLAPLAFGSLVAGAALLGTERRDLAHLRDTCAPACTSSDVRPLRLREPLSYALLGVGGGLAVVDVILWVVLSKKGSGDRTRAALEPSATSLRGRF